MRIALAALSCDDSTGIGRIVRSLAREFTARGHEVTVVAQRIEHLPPGVRSALVSPVALSNGVSRMSFNHQTRLLFRRNRFGIVNAFGVGRGASVVSAQSCHASAVGLQKESRRGRLAHRGIGLFDAVALRDERKLVTSTDTRLVIAVSSLVKSQLLEHYGVLPEKVKVIPNGIDLQALTARDRPAARSMMRAEAGFEDADFGLIFIGNEFDRKGLQTVIEALGRGGDERMKLAVLGGDNPDAYQSVARKVGVGHRVRFLGRVDGPERYLPAADALVLPAWYEPFGMVIVEAMGAGVPVIASASAGALEGLQHEVHALFLQNPRDAEELAGALRRLRDDACLRQTLSLRAKEAAQEFSWEKVSAMTLAAYAGVAGIAESPV